MIHTALHRLAEIAGAEPLVMRMHGVAHYAVAMDVIQIMTRDDVQKSVLAMLEAGIAHLPYPEMLVEFSVAPGCVRFVLLKERSGGFSAEGAVLVRNELADISPTHARIAVTPCGLTIDRAFDGSEADAFVLAAALGLLMLNIRGIDKQVVEPRALNKARRAHGRPTVPTHTVVRIGTVFDRAGRGHAGAIQNGRRMPVHLRAGHTRMQACGPEHSERRPVYIPPVLVNYREDEPVAKQPKRLVRA